MQLEKLPQKPGVYLFKDNKGIVLYVGKAVNLKRRVSSYFTGNLISGKTSILVSKVCDIETIEVISELEALLLEAHLIKKFQPFFNSRAKDDKHPLYIKITTNDKYPRVFTVRREDSREAVYFGPFPSSSTVREILKLLRSIFPFDTQNNIGKRACFWNHIGLCNPCPSVIDNFPEAEKKLAQARYKKNIRNLLSVLSRKTDKVKDDLARDMEKASKELNFEEAARIRNQIRKLDYITREYKSVSSYLENPNLVSDIRKNESDELREILASHFQLPTSISRIECFDASHTAMSSPTVSMVTFIDGEPDKNFYRKFRIRNENIKDDLSFLEEALRRRFSHREWVNPDLLIMDGGKTQVGRALDTLRSLGINIPLVGIVKPFDDLVIPHTRSLPAGRQGFLIKRTKGPARALIQRLRDEAHRFAKAYHQKLRGKLSLS